MRTLYVCFLLLLQSCAEDNGASSANLPGIEALSNGNKQIYAELKGIPERAEDRIDRNFEALQQRVRVAAHLAENELNDDKAASLLALESYSDALIDYYFNRYLSNTVGEESLKAFYDKNPETFAVKKVHLGNILIRANSRMTPEELEQRKAKAVDIVTQLRAGADFVKLVERVSEDSASKGNKGDIGWLDTTNGDPVLVEAALALKAGQYSDPINTSRGFQIIALLEDPVIEPQPFDVIKDKLRYQLQEQAKRAEWDRLVSAAEK